MTQENKMGTMPVNRLLVTMSLPMVISMLVQAMYNIVDSIFVSMISQSALTAVSMAFPVQNLIIAVSAGTCVGVNALLSRSPCSACSAPVSSLRARRTTRRSSAWAPSICKSAVFSAWASSGK